MATTATDVCNKGGERRKARGILYCGSERGALPGKETRSNIYNNGQLSEAPLTFPLCDPLLFDFQKGNSMEKILIR